MKIKEIHDYSLSLFIRGLGVWLLYQYLPFVTTFVDDFSRFVKPPDSRWTYLGWDLVYFIVRLVIAGYFILGAPPFLRWATRDKNISN